MARENQSVGSLAPYGGMLIRYFGDYLIFRLKKIANRHTDKTGSAKAEPVFLSGSRAPNYGFFFFPPTLVSIPPVSWLTCTSPSFACMPQVPLGSSSTAFW